jgi:putative DNA primase/helicase
MLNHSELSRVLRAAGLIIQDFETRKFERCPTLDDKGGQKSGFYCVFEGLGITTCVYGDWRSGAYNTWTSKDSRHQTPKQRAEVRLLIEQAQRAREMERVEQWAKNHIKLKKLWAETKPLRADDAVSRYLANRGLTIPDCGAIRSHEGLDYWHGGHCVGAFPAMLGAITSPSGELVSIHRTYLTGDGYKATVPTVKKLCASAGPLLGASIKIRSPTRRDDGSLSLGISEGIETALAASALFGVPVWAGVSAHGLASFEPPPNVKNIYIFSDNDASHVGQDTAKKLAERLTYQGHIVRVHTPAIVGDWCDELASMEVQS